MRATRAALVLGALLGSVPLACGGESVLGFGPSDDGVGATGGSGSGGDEMGTGATGGVIGSGATGGNAGAGATSNGGTGGWAGQLDGTAGGPSQFDCFDTDIVVRFKKNCARTGCHNQLDHYAGIDFSDPYTGWKLVNRPASFGDINCAAIGEPFMTCDPPPDACPPGALLINSWDPEESWILKKLRGEQIGCGDRMPLAPGNSASNGWGDEAQTCIENWFYAWAAAGPH